MSSPKKEATESLSLTTWQSSEGEEESDGGEHWMEGNVRRDAALIFLDRLEASRIISIAMSPFC